MSVSKQDTSWGGLNACALGAKSTARVSSRKYFIPGCVGRGLDLDLRIRPAAAPAPAAASGNPGLGPLGIKVEKQGFRTAWLITGQKFP